MYENMYTSFDPVDFGETSDISKNEIPDNYTYDDWFESEEAGATWFEQGHDPVYPMNQVSSVHENYYTHSEETTNQKNEATKVVSGKVRHRVAFKTISDIEILEDGFKWRKYGKKMVKNNANPRNYYKCSVEKCPVKKRVERDDEDPRYVITTYEGNHTHASPSGY